MCEEWRSDEEEVEEEEVDEEAEALVAEEVGSLWKLLDVKE